MSYSQVSKPFAHWLANLDELDGWLYVSEKIEVLAPDTPCECIKISNEISPEEQDAADIEISQKGLVCTFDRASIEMVISNLQQQLPAFNQNQCMQALNYYWANDGVKGVRVNWPAFHGQ